MGRTKISLCNLGPMNVRVQAMRFGENAPQSLLAGFAYEWWYSTLDAEPRCRATMSVSAEVESEDLRHQHFLISMTPCGNIGGVQPG